MTHLIADDRKPGRANLVANAHRRAHERFDLIRDYLDAGIDPQRIAADLGVTASAIERQAYRYGQSDLARIFAAYRDWKRTDRRRRHPCADCGTPVAHLSTRCRQCNASWHNSTTNRIDAAA